MTDEEQKIADILRAVVEIDLRGSAYWASLCADSAGRMHIHGGALPHPDLPRF